MENDMKKYVGIDTDGLAVSGMWHSDSLMPEGQTLQELTGSADIGWTFDGTSWVAPLVDTNELRAERDRLLADTDWIMVSDYPGTDQAAWAVYRQALRDLPEGYTPSAYPDYPVKPGE